MLGIEGDAVGFADAVAIHQVGRHQIAGRNGGGVADRQRRVAQRAADRPPQVDHLHAAAQQVVRFVAEEVAHALRAGPFGVIDMHAGRGLARRAGGAILRARHAAAQRVVEHEDLAGAGGFGDQALGLGVVDAAEFVLVVEVVHRAGVVQHRKTFAVERDVRRDRARALDRHAVRVARGVGAGDARRRFEGVVAWPFGRGGQVVQLGLDVRQVGVGRHGSAAPWRVGQGRWVGPGVSAPMSAGRRRTPERPAQLGVDIGGRGAEVVQVVLIELRQRTPLTDALAPEPQRGRGACQQRPASRAGRAR